MVAGGRESNLTKMEIIEGEKSVSCFCSCKFYGYSLFPKSAILDKCIPSSIYRVVLLFAFGKRCILLLTYFTFTSKDSLKVCG